MFIQFYFVPLPFIMIEITSLDDSRVSMFSQLTEAQLRMTIEPERGLFIAESPKVIRIALDAGWEPVALLCEHKHIMGDAKDIVERLGSSAGYGCRTANP